LSSKKRGDSIPQYSPLSWGARSVEVSVGDYVPVTNPGPDQAERTFERVIGESAALESVLEQVEQVAPTDSSVLTEGETGTGKELIAHAIHNAACVAGALL
jgi:transcriptional regulator with PAS, ATPase and Fis domain